MTSDPSDAERRRALNRLGVNWPDGWTRGVIEEFALATSDFTPNELDGAVTTAIAQRTIRPKPAQLRDLVTENRKITRAKAKARENRDAGDGRGCPECRREHGTHRHEEWRGDGSIITCLTHRLSWPGTTHDPNTTDHGELTPDEWREHALRGEFGEVLQVAAYQTKPDQIVHELAAARRQ